MAASPDPGHTRGLQSGCAALGESLPPAPLPQTIRAKMLTILTAMATMSVTVVVPSTGGETEAPSFRFPRRGLGLSSTSAPQSTAGPKPQPA